MRKWVVIVAMIGMTFGASAQEVARRVDIEQVEVTTRSVRECGMQTTQLDSTVLRESPTFSLAEVLAQNTNIFVKSYGRGTLATPSLRGTSASHTKVLWNGLEINSPLLGSIDLSTIPSIIIDKAVVHHGAASIESTTGALGGAVNIASEAARQQGLNISVVSGAGSFCTFDEFLRVDYSEGRISSSSRVAYTYSRNDFPYTNYYKKTNLRYDTEGKLVGWDYPVERNRGGEIKDLHIVQSLGVNFGTKGELNADIWYSRLDRGLPMLSVSYRQGDDYINNQTDNTLRTTIRWRLLRHKSSIQVGAGYIFTNLRYTYSRDAGTGQQVLMIDSGNRLHTIKGSATGSWYLGKWLLSATGEVRQDIVSSRDYRYDKESINGQLSGFDNGRATFDATLSAKWQSLERLSVGATLREQICGNQVSKPIPALFVESVLSAKGDIVLRASATRNYRFPTLNDLYCKPGGNPLLKPEEGFSYDVGLSTKHSWEQISIHAKVTWFDSYIDNWILWLPTFNGFWSPVNVRRVHSYGIESAAGGMWRFGKDWELSIEGCFAWTPSINMGGDEWSSEAQGKQLVYVPRLSSSIVGTLSWRGWELRYRWNYYSERYTTSSNQTATRLGVLQPYFMSDLSLGKRWVKDWGKLGVKFSINNLLNEEYESVLSRPMPRQNYYVTLEFSPSTKITSPRKRTR